MTLNIQIVCGWSNKVFLGLALTQSKKFIFYLVLDVFKDLKIWMKNIICDSSTKANRHYWKRIIKNWAKKIMDIPKRPAWHQNVDPLVVGPQHVLGRDSAIVKDEFAGARAPNPELVQLRPGRKPFHALFDEEGGDAVLRFWVFGVGLGVDDQHVGVLAISDPELGAVQDVRVAVFGGSCFHWNDIYKINKKSFWKTIFAQRS